MSKRYLILFFGFIVLTVLYSQDSLNMRLLGVWAPEDTSIHTTIGPFVVSGNYLFVSTMRGGRDTIYIVNVSDPSEPRVVGKLANVGGYLAIMGNYLYVGNDLKIIDISRPDFPDIVYDGSTEGPIVNKVSVICPYSDSTGVYLACECAVDSSGERGVRIVDVTEPSSPELLDWYYIPDEITHPFYFVVHSLESIDVVYPHLFVFETVHYSDTSDPAGGYWVSGSVIVKMFDLRDLTAPPVVWTTGEMFVDPDRGLDYWGAVAGSAGVYLSCSVSSSLPTIWFFLSYDDSSLE